MKEVNVMEIPNDISQIAVIIQNDWKKVSLKAAPYLKAMHKLHSIYDRYGKDSAKSIIKDFLNNAKYWQGEVAREVKKKLNEMIS